MAENGKNLCTRVPARTKKLTLQRGNKLGNVRRKSQLLAFCCVAWIAIAGWKTIKTEFAYSAEISGTWDKMQSNRRGWVNFYASRNPREWPSISFSFSGLHPIPTHSYMMYRMSNSSHLLSHTPVGVILLRLQKKLLD